MTATLGYCQSGYPEKIVLGNDTVVCINGDQLVKINQGLLLLEYNEKKVDSLELKVSLLSKVVSTDSVIYDSLRAEIKGLKEVNDIGVSSLHKVQKEYERVERKRKRLKVVTLMSIVGNLLLMIGIYVK